MHFSRARLMQNLVQKDHMKIGYARVSTEEQNLDLQIEALTEVECVRIVTDQTQSGTKSWAFAVRANHPEKLSPRFVGLN